MSKTNSMAVFWIYCAALWSIIPAEKAKNNIMSFVAKLQILALKEKDKRNFDILRELGVGESPVWRASFLAR